MVEIDGINGREITYIPDRLIADPVVFRGMTDAEVVTLMVVGLVVWTPISVLILMPLGYALFGVALGVGLAIGSLLFSGSYLIRLKRKQPDGLHIVYFKKLLQRHGLKRFGFIDESISWDIRRSTPVKRIEVYAIQDSDSWEK